MQAIHGGPRVAPYPPIDLERGEAGERAMPPAPSTEAARTGRAAGWSAVREFGAQSAGTLAGLAVRNALHTAGPAAVAAGGVVTLAGLGLSALRASELIAGVACPQSRRGRLSARAAAAALPAAGVVAGACLAASAGTLPAVTAYVAGKLVQRSVRDLCSQATQGVLPVVEAVDDQGQAVSKEDLAVVDWGRAVRGVLPAAAYFAAQEFLAPAPGPGTPLAAALPHVAGRALVEAARAATGTCTAARLARSEGHHLRGKDGGGVSALAANLRTLATLRQAADATAMREYFGLVTDLFTLLAGTPPDALSRALLKLLRAELKALGEFRAPLVTRGQLALARQWQERLQALEPGPLAGSAPEVVGGDSGMAYPDESDAVVIHIRAPAAR